MAVGCFGDWSSCGAAGDRGHTIYYYTYTNSLAVFEFSLSGSSVLRCVSGALQRINILLHQLHLFLCLHLSWPPSPGEQASSHFTLPCHFPRKPTSILPLFHSMFVPSRLPHVRFAPNSVPQTALLTSHAQPIQFTCLHI